MTRPARNAHRLGPALVAGAIGIAVNTALLAAADRIPLVTARGGLLKLISPYAGPVLRQAGVGRAWAGLGLPVPGGTAFQLGFHAVVGLGMAVLYGLLLERVLPWRPWVRGLLYAAAVWLANAFVVLPMLGEGVAGSRVLSGAGMAYFAAAHTVFFVLLAILFSRLRRVPALARAHRPRHGGA